MGDANTYANIYVLTETNYGTSDQVQGNDAVRVKTLSKTFTYTGTLKDFVYRNKNYYGDFLMDAVVKAKSSQQAAEQDKQPNQPMCRVSR